MTVKSLNGDRLFSRTGPVRLRFDRTAELKSTDGPVGQALSGDRLCFKTDPARLPFDSTAELKPGNGPVGQDRAMRAVEFGARIAQPGYNIVVTGPPGSGKHTSVKRALEQAAATMPVPPDLAYVHNFKVPHMPAALKFPAGEGTQFKSALADFVAGLTVSMPALFATEEYRTHRAAIEGEFFAHVKEALEALRQLAERQGLALVERDEGTFDFYPQRDGLAISEDEYRRLPKAERDGLGEKAGALRGKLDKITGAIGELRAHVGTKLRALERGLGEKEVRRLMAPLGERFAGNPEARFHLKAIVEDVIAHLDALQAAARGEERKGERTEVPFHRYDVNLLVDNSGLKGAPVVSLPLPSLSHLVGKVEHVPVLVTIITDFMFIRAGALHKANGGFLLIDALDLLRQDVSWESLKRALREEQIRIENLAEVLDRDQTVSIRPQAVPLDLKIVLFGESWIFHRLRELDPDFEELFKVQSDFSTTVDRNELNCKQLLALLSEVAHNENLKQLDRTGAAQLLDEAARMAGDAQKICVRTGKLSNLLREADYCAARAERKLIAAQDVAHAVAAGKDRAGRLKADGQELIKRRIVLIDTDGARVGQINALTVVPVPGFAFGVPTRITARVQPGNGSVIDIERLVELGGPGHTKGVQILSGYLNGHYATSRALSLTATLAFEQSFRFVDGDSASVAELIAILSAIADVPLKQGIAVTGSVNQHGSIQSVGGVNEKIEGFFDICMSRGLNKENGVIIPKINLANLMLKDDVVDAAHSGHFRVFAVETADEAVEILTGMQAGTRKENGAFPRGTFNRRVADRLMWFARPRILKPVHLDSWWRR
jgi:lon-related putative ATP-dependent protease